MKDLSLSGGKSVMPLSAFLSWPEDTKGWSGGGGVVLCYLRDLNLKTLGRYFLELRATAQLWLDEKSLALYLFVFAAFLRSKDADTDSLVRGVSCRMEDGNAGRRRLPTIFINTSSERCWGYSYSSNKNILLKPSQGL